MPRYGAEYGPDLAFLGVGRSANRVVLEALSAIARRRSGSPWDPALPLLADRPTPEDMT